MIGALLGLMPGGLLGWIIGPTGRAIGVVVGIVAALGVPYFMGRNHAMKTCREGSLKAELAIARADIEAARKAAEDSKSRAIELADLVVSNKEKIRELEAARAKVPAPACRLSDGEARRLRSIR